jgi:hypothetical protein
MNLQHTPVVELIRAVQRQMRIEFDQKTTQIPHMGERGAAREEVVRSFLRDYLPKRFAVSPGFILDADGMVSRQIDAVIYDELCAPVFRVTETQRLFPAESVAGAVSIKSTLTRQELAEAVENLASAALLNRFGSGRPEVVFGGVPTPFVHSAFQGHPAHPVFTAAFAFESPPLETVASNLHDLNRSLDPMLRIQLIAVLNRGVVTYLDEGVIEPTYSATARVAFVEDPEIALPLFYVFLANGTMRKLPLSISFRAYLRLDTVPVRCVD